MSRWIMRNCQYLVGSVLLTSILASTAFAVQPSLTAMNPQGIRRGVDTEVTISGARLADAKELLFYQPGVVVKSLTPASETQVKAVLTVAADCKLGIHAFRMATASGVSNLRTFTVGHMAEVTEVEPNSDFAAPQVVAINSTVNGVVLTEDVDYYVVDAKKGQRISAELEGIRLGLTFFDAYVAILNSARFELARSDDAALLRQDCLCTVVAPEDGKYIVQVRESSYGGNSQSKYRLHIGEFPRPLSVVPAGGKPGETINAKWTDATGAQWESQITLPTDGSPVFDAFAQDERGVSPSPNRLRVVDLDNVIEVEPNNSWKEATPASAPAAYNGVISEPGDTDYFKFTAKKGQRYSITVFARKVLRSRLDSVLYVRNAATGASVGSNDDSGGPDSAFQFTAPADGDYSVGIRDHLNAGGPNYAYRIELAPLKPKLTFTVPEKVRYFSTTISVPQGNNVAMMMSASRAGFGGDLGVEFAGIPTGLSAGDVKYAANQTSIPVLFSAAADAPVAASLVDVVGKLVDPAKQIVGHLSQRTMLVRGQNNRDVWGHDGNRMAIAVTNKVPFRIEIVQPKVPVVRNGSMQLKVIAHREEGHTAAIRLRMLYNPSGIGSSGSISIPANKNEASIPMTANGGAVIGKWPIIIVGQSAVGNGTVEVATQMAELEVADRFFDLAIQKSAGELGQSAQIVVKVTKKIDFAEIADVQLLGLPANTTGPTEPGKLSQDSEEIVFNVVITEKARPGTYKSLVCRAILMRNGEPITTTLGGGELRVDKPLPPKVDAPKPAPKPMPVPKPVVAEAPKEKPLSRLEKLRKAREEAKQGQ
jgi:hypothetical protein